MWLQVSHVSIIYRHGTHPCILLMHMFAPKTMHSLFNLHYVIKVTLHCPMLHHFKTHFALELSSVALYHAATSLLVGEDSASKQRDSIIFQSLLVILSVKRKVKCDLL